MSVKVMTAVFERYPGGGGEMLLALALADHASDDGSRVFPGIKALSEKTRQSERTVQYQLRRMEEMGWLILVGVGNGGRSMHREYRISLCWIKGAEIAPFKKGATDGEKGATDDTKGCNPRQERVQPVAPANNHHGIIKESSGKGESAGAQDGFAPSADAADADQSIPGKTQTEDGPAESPATTRPASMAGAVCMVLKACGMQSVSPSNPSLQVLIDNGASIDEFAAVARDCVKNGKPFNYLLKTVAGRMKDAAALAETAMAAPQQAAGKHPPAANKHAGAVAAIWGGAAGRNGNHDGRTIDV